MQASRNPQPVDMLTLRQSEDILSEARGVLRTRNCTTAAQFKYNILQVVAAPCRGVKC